MYFMGKTECLKMEGSRLEAGGTEGTLEGGFLGGFGAVVGERFQDGFGAAGLVGEQDRQRFLEAIEAEVGFAGVAFDPVEEGGEVDQLAARVHEMEVEEFLLAGHGGILRGETAIPSGKARQPAAGGI
jgi:hypothetical protein